MPKRAPEHSLSHERPFGTAAKQDDDTGHSGLIMSGLRDRIKEGALLTDTRIVFPEFADARVNAAAGEIEKSGRLHPILFSEALLAAHHDDYAALHIERCTNVPLTDEQAWNTVADPLTFGALMVAAGDADGCVAGASHTDGACPPGGLAKHWA